jgi:hypothetical protein
MTKYCGCHGCSVICDEIYDEIGARHSVWTSYRASYPALRIYDEIWLFVMDAVWSMTKSKYVMRISSWIKGFLVVVNDPELAFEGKVGLGPFWTWSRSCSTTTWCTSPSAPLSPPSGTRVQLPFGRSIRGCKCKI